MTSEQLEELRARCERESAKHWMHASPPSWSDVSTLLAEVSRLRRGLDVAGHMLGDAGAAPSAQAYIGQVLRGETV